MPKLCVTNTGAGRAGYGQLIAKLHGTRLKPGVNAIAAIVLSERCECV